MELGIVGLPQVGKKTLFELLTGEHVDPARRAAGEAPVLGVAKVRDPRFDRLAEIYKPKRQVPATITFSLLPDLENDAQRDAKTFRLAEQTDALCYVARAFEDPSVFHVEGTVDPGRDIGLFCDELLLQDLMFIEKRFERIAKDLRSQSRPEKLREKAVLERMQAHLEAGEPLRTFPFTEEDLRIISGYPFITTKQLIVIVNIGEDEIRDDSRVRQLQERFSGLGIQWMPVCAKIEQELMELDDPEERQMFLDDLGIKTPALALLTILAYRALGLISFFTVSSSELRQWTIPKDSTAPRAARAIHADLERGFIRAEVIHFEDMDTLGNEAEVKKAGKLMLRGKDYVVQDGDIITIRFNV